MQPLAGRAVVPDMTSTHAHVPTDHHPLPPGIATPSIRHGAQRLWRRPEGGPLKPQATSDEGAVPAWSKLSDGTMAAKLGPFQLLVHPPTPGAYARFVVTRRAEADQGAGALLQSGTREGFGAAIRGAEAAARRLLAALEP